MAVVPQETQLAFDYTVLEVVLMGRYPHLGAFEIEGPADIGVAREALAATGTVALQNRAVLDAQRRRKAARDHRRRAGADQRPGAGSAGLSNGTTRVLLLDEPTAALDLKYQLERRRAPADRCTRSAALTIVVSTHDLNFAAGLCRTLVMLKEGQVLAAGPADEVLTPARIRELYGVDAEVARHPRSGPSRRRADRRPGGSRVKPRRAAGSALTLLVFGALAAAAIVLGAAHRIDAHQPAPRVRLGRCRSPTTSDAQIFFVARLPRTLAGALVGSMLATAGVVFQGLLRNPLATPFTLGVSAGAALGAMLAITFGAVARLGRRCRWRRSPASPARWPPSAIVYLLAQARHRGLSTNVLLLAGVTMNAFFSALILFVQYFADFAETFRILRWLMGDLDVSSYQPLLTALPLVIVSFAVFAWLARPLNLLSLGPDAAETRGLDVHARAARRVLQRVARHRRRGVGRRSGRLHRHHRAAPRPAAGRRGPPHRAAGVGALRRGVPDRVRCGRAHGDGAARAAGRRHHGADRRTVLSVAAGEANDETSS